MGVYEPAAKGVQEALRKLKETDYAAYMFLTKGEQAFGSEGVPGFQTADLSSKIGNLLNSAPIYQACQIIKEMKRLLCKKCQDTRLALELGAPECEGCEFKLQ